MYRRSLSRRPSLRFGAAFIALMALAGTARGEDAGPQPIAAASEPVPLPMATATPVVAPPPPVASPPVVAPAVDPAAPASSDNASLYCRNIANAAADARYARQANALAAMEKELDDRLGKLEAKRAEVEDWIKRRQEFLDKADAAVVAIYSQMRPDAAAQQIAVMEPEAAAAILARLNPRIASAILNEMSATVAATLTTVMAGMPGPPKPPSPAG
jgi:flagellar motility protein MotE (MotC chaperone)